MGSIIIIAPPAAGKGTQSKLISTKYNISHVSTGDLLRDEIKNKTVLGSKIEEVIKSGELVSDDLILSSLKNKIKNLRTYILDGFPRNIHQAIEYDKLLIEMNQNIDYVFYISLDKEIAKKRITSRISCSNCGRVYNTEIEESKPKNENVCDECSHVLIKRDDDNEETFENRYNIYINDTYPLVDYYKSKNLLYEIDGCMNKESIFKEICSIMGDNNDNN